MSNALFLIYFSIVNGVETPSLTEAPGHSRTAVGSAPGTAGGGPCPAVQPPQEALLCVSAPSRTPSRASPPTWHCQGIGLLSRVSRMPTSCGTGPRGLLEDDALWSPLTWWGALPGVAHAASVCASGRLLHPTQGKGHEDGKNEARRGLEGARPRPGVRTLSFLPTCVSAYRPY